MVGRQFRQVATMLTEAGDDPLAFTRSRRSVAGRRPGRPICWNGSTRSSSDAPTSSASENRRVAAAAGRRGAGRDARPMPGLRPSHLHDSSGALLTEPDDSTEEVAQPALMASQSHLPRPSDPDLLQHRRGRRPPLWRTGHAKVDCNSLGAEAAPLLLTHQRLSCRSPVEPSFNCPLTGSPGSVG
jgi:hypothetical protein